MFQEAPSHIQERKPLYLNSTPAKERLESKFMIKDPLLSRRGSSVTVMSPFRAKTLTEVTYLERNCDNKTMSQDTEETADNFSISNLANLFGKK